MSDVAAIGTARVMTGLADLAGQIQEPRLIATIVAGCIAATLNDETIDELIRLMGTMRGKD